MKTQLEEAKKQGVTVIPVSHHNLLDESTLYPEECTIENTKEVTALLEAYGVPVYLSGHLHLQRIKKHTSNLNTPGGYGIREIVTSPLPMAPCQYSILNWQTDGSLSYHTKKVDIAGWAQRYGEEDENLLNFDAYADQFLVDVISEQTFKALQSASKDIKEEMARLYADMNRDYCSGTKIDVAKIRKSEAYQYWIRYSGNDFWLARLQAILHDARTNNTIKEGTTYYRFPCEVSSYEMTQDIKAQMFDGNGNCGKEYTYTVRDYAQYILNHVDLYVDTYPFAVAMLNYGACSQKYFNQAVEELANKYLNDDGQEIPDRFDGYIDGFVAKKAENDVLGQFAGLSMVLKSETTLNLFYEPKEGIDVSKLIFSVDGKEITPIKRGQYYILSLENIGANELGNSKTFTVTDGTNTLSGDYCAMMYCYQVLNAAEGTYKDDLVTLVKAFSNYAYTARSVCQSN